MKLKDIKIGMMIELKEDVNKWGYITSISDDNTCVYFNPNGTSLFYLCIPIDKITGIKDVWVGNGYKTEYIE